MGGNALKNFGVRRVDRETYDRICRVVYDKVSPISDKYLIPCDVDNKADFGDVDVLTVIKPEVVDLPVWIRDTFKPRAVISNGGCHSFNVEDLQVDLITTSKEKFENHYAFLCYGDLGMTMGRVSRLYDLKYGIDGLEMPIRNPETNHVVAEILVSRRPRKIFPFLGYDYDQFDISGFSNEEELMKYAFSSRLIHKGFMTADSEDTKHKKRDKKRARFARWHQWFMDNIEKFPDAKDVRGVPNTIDEKITYIEYYFPESNLRFEYDRTIAEIATFNSARERFSGKHIMAIYPEFIGPKLGTFMSLWNAQWESKLEQAKFINRNSIDTLVSMASVIANNPLLSPPSS